MELTGLQEKVVLITGANHGIGAATALAFAAQQAKVFITSFREACRFSEDELKRARDDGIGGEALYRAMQQQIAEPLVHQIRRQGGVAAAHEFDLGDPANIPLLFDRCEAALGPVDVLVNNHTYCVNETFDPALATDEGFGVQLPTAAGIDAHFAVNARAYALMMSEYLQRFLRRGAAWGRIINVSTDAAHAHVANISYAASKHAIESYSRSAAAELGRYGITVNIAAPALGAVLLLALPMWGVLSVDVITAAVAVTPLLFIKIPQPAKPVGRADKGTSVFSEMREGFRFLRSWKGALILILMIMVINLLFTPADALLPLLVTEHFGEGLVEFATIQIAIGVSFILGGLALGAWGGFKRKVVTMLVSGVVSGVGIVVVGIAPSDGFYLAVAGMSFAGFMIAILNGSAQALMQSSIPPDKQGRVFGLMGSLTVAMAPIGLAVAGPVSDLFGVQIWFLVSGLGLSVIFGSGFFMRSVMTMDDVVSCEVAVEEK